WNAVALNPAARKLFAGWLDGKGKPPNLLRFMFGSAAAQSLTVEWEQRARRLVAEFRADSASLLDDPELLGLVDELSAASPL
ncbi:transcriptional regulator, partial [Salmonella enterica]